MAVSDGPFVKIHDGLVAAENDLSSDGVKQLVRKKWCIGVLSFSSCSLPKLCIYELINFGGKERPRDAS